MRCSECSQRNSVAAKKCASCGSTLRRKPLPLGFKVFAGTLICLICVFFLTALSTTINNPEKNLTSTASTLTGKSKSAEQIMGNMKQFDEAMRQFLQRYGSLSNEQLSNRLSNCLPKSLYEDHVFELLPNLKLVEIDTALNPANYLILLSNGKSEVLPIIGLDVYDSNSFLPQNTKLQTGKKEEGQLLVLLGHSTGINGHHPRVKVLLLSSTLQSDNVVDLTDTVVPKIYGEGSAKFSPNQKDIELLMSLYSAGQELNLFSTQQLKASLPIDDEVLYQQLPWQNNSYSLHIQPGTSKLYALFTAASSLKNHNKIGRFHGYLSANARRTIEQTPTVKSEDGFIISSKSGKKFNNTNNIYILKNNSLSALIELRPISSGNKAQPVRWYVNSLSISKVIPSTNIPAPTKVTVGSQPVVKDIIKKDIVKTEVIEEKPKMEEQALQATFVPGLKANIKMRNGPGTNYESIYEIKPNKHISIIGKDKGWYRVKIDNKEGFIYAGLISNNKNSPYRSAIIKQGSTVKDEEQNSIGTVQTGEHLIIISKLNNRYKIMLSNGKTGYVNKSAIDGISADSPPPSVP